MSAELTAAELVAELVARGASLRSIGDAIGRDSSLLSKVTRNAAAGKVTGSNLVGPLAALREQLHGVRAGDAPAAARAAHVPQASRRRDRAGAVAGVRRPTTIGKPGWSIGKVKQQATRNGARGLGRTIRQAADEGHDNAAVTVRFRAGAGGLHVTNQSPKKRKGKGGGTTSPDRHYRPGERGTIHAKLDTAELAAAVERTGGNVTAAVLSLLASGGYVGEGHDSSTYEGLEVSLY